MHCNNFSKVHVRGVMGVFFFMAAKLQDHSSVLLWHVGEKLYQVTSLHNFCAGPHLDWMPVHNLDSENQRTILLFLAVFLLFYRSRHKLYIPGVGEKAASHPDPFLPPQWSHLISISPLLQLFLLFHCSSFSLLHFINFLRTVCTYLIFLKRTLFLL